MGKAAGAMGLALGAAAVAGATAIFALGVKLGDTADELLDLNSITGMTTDAIQKWRKAAQVAGVDTNAMTNASQKLTKTMDLMSTGTGKAAEGVQKLGLSVKEIEGMSADERMDALTEALAGVEDKTERARIGTDLFGGTWKEIAPVVDLGAEAMAKAKESANIISSEDLTTANEFRIKIADMKDQVGFFVTKLVVGLMPMLNKFMVWIKDKMPPIQATMEIVFDKIGEVISNVVGFVRDQLIPKLKELWEWLEPHMPIIKQFFADAFEKASEFIKDATDKIKDFTKWIQDHWNVVGPILTGITAAFLLYKTTMIAIAIAKGIFAIATGVATGAATAFGAVMAFITSPIFLVVAAIGVLIAIGLLLYKNWDVVSEFLKNIWEWIKKTAVNVFNSIKDFFIKWGALILAIILGPIGILALLIFKNWDKIKETAIKVFTAIKDFLSGIWNGIKTTISNIINGIATTISKVFNGVKNTLTKVFNSIKDTVMGIWNGLVDGIKGGINFIINGINVFIKGLNKMKIPDWVPLVGGKGISLPEIPKLEVGLDYVPYDEFPAILHKGERVMTAEENKSDGGKSAATYNIYLNNMPAADADKRKLAQYIEEERRRGMMAKGMVPA